MKRWITDSRAHLQNGGRRAWFSLAKLHKKISKKRHFRAELNYWDVKYVLTEWKDALKIHMKLWKTEKNCVQANEPESLNWLRIKPQRFPSISRSWRLYLKISLLLIFISVFFSLNSFIHDVLLLWCTIVAVAMGYVNFMFIKYAIQWFPQVTIV